MLAKGGKKNLALHSEGMERKKKTQQHRTLTGVEMEVMAVQEELLDPCEVSCLDRKRAVIHFLSVWPGKRHLWRDPSPTPGPLKEKKKER